MKRIFLSSRTEFCDSNRLQNLKHFIMVIVAVLLMLLPSLLMAQASCGFGESTIELYRSYGIASTDNGYVNDPDNSIGYPDGDHTHLDPDNDPNKRGLSYRINRYSFTRRYSLF